MPKVLCVGHACYDVVFPLDGFLEENRKYLITESRESSGGPACNAASVLGLFGTKTAFAGLVGSDLYGDRIAADLAEAGIDLRLLERRKSLPTPLSFILANGRTGSRTIVNRKDLEAGLSLEPERFLEAYGDEPPEVLLFDGHEYEASIAAMKAFPGAASILDAGSRRPATEALLQLVDYCVASERFALEITGREDLAEAERKKAALLGLWERNRKKVAITLGGEGCIYLERGTAWLLPVLPVKAVDSTAAGDIFHGAFAWALVSGREFREALRFASAAAGLSVTRLGGRASIPKLAEVEEALSAWTEGVQDLGKVNS